MFYFMLPLLLFFVWAPISPASAAPADIEFSKALCGAPKDDSTIRKEDADRWSPCERWVWSCVRQGLEANLFERECVEPRSERMEDLRKKWRDLPLEGPGQIAESNALGDKFLRAIISTPFYSDQIPPSGIRIFGAYFKDAVNLENVSATRNIVLDGSVFMSGLRLSNFRAEKNLSLDGSNVRRKLILLRVRIDGTLFLNRGIYDFVDLRDARIGASIEATRSIFNDELRMDRAHIEGKVYLIKSRLTYLTAWDAVIGGSLELRMADVRLGIDMTGSTVNGDVRLQRVTFGQLNGPSEQSCAFDQQAMTKEAPSDDLLNDIFDRYRSNESFRQLAINEAVQQRPLLNKPLCKNETIVKDADAHKDVLLRDMKIKGTLCLFDVTGEIAPSGKQGESGEVPRGNIETISLDGTQANSTVLKWKDSASRTLWRAVNFKTSYMLINLDKQPQRHFIDNFDVGFIAFVKGEPVLRSHETGDDDKFLCDVTPSAHNKLLSNSRDAHQRLAQFFTGSANESGSIQPFSKIAARLEESGASSTYLKTRLSEYRLGKVCATSALTKQWNVIRDHKWRTIPQRMVDAYSNALRSGEIHDPRDNPSDLIVEGNRLVWDGVCQSGMMVYASTVSYGHEPYNLFLYIVFFIGVFWLLLQLDAKRSDAKAAGDKLGLVYCIDSFVPLPQMKLDRRSARLLPKRRALQFYLKFHKFVGLVFAVLVFMFIYRAAQ
jgi:hypothetical protein